MSSNNEDIIKKQLAANLELHMQVTKLTEKNEELYRDNALIVEDMTRYVNQLKLQNNQISALQRRIEYLNSK